MYLKCGECSWTSLSPKKTEGERYRIWRNSRQLFCMMCEKFTVHARLAQAKEGRDGGL
jgi:hypothetical protein